ncbi:hypothetical protein [Schleiferilactobacillus harbinensis]|uniref:hypothetical protein n=1 Tax=Schleiferilactobacillus harbinensis TaxID=304207 RepID=UPI00242A9804|nr:hypothetical protein [Schleiferilactobacillus harbinensis]MCI1851055.1 hypothetical protein [Schleiferilactobacillus harbinensis]
MKWIKGTFVMLLLMLYVGACYGAWKTIMPLIQNKEKFPLLNALFTINLSEMLLILEYFVAASVVVSFVFLIPWFVIIYFKNSKSLIIKPSVVIAYFKVCTLISLTLSILVSLNQTQLDIVASLLSILALFSFLVPHKKEKSSQLQKK